MDSVVNSFYKRNEFLCTSSIVWLNCAIHERQDNLWTQKRHWTSEIMKGYSYLDTTY